MARGVRLAAVLVAAATASGGAQPRWQLKVQAHPPGVVTLFDVLGRAEVYWYFPFTLTNRTGRELDVFVTARALTDTKRTYTAGYYPEAKRRLERILGRRLRGLWEVRGKMPARASWEVVALFRDMDPNMDRVAVRLRGLEDPVLRIKGVSYLEVRALEFLFEQLGDEYYPWEDPVRFLGRRWVVLKQRSRIPRR